MRSRTLLLAFALSSALLIVDAQRVAIIGAGIGGGATSYYLRRQFPDVSGLEIDVFDRNDYVGGRLKHIRFDGVDLNVGGDAFSVVNEYVVELSRELGLRYDNTSYNGNGQTGLWDGTRFYPLNLRQHLLSDAKLLAQMELLRYHLRRNYEERGSSGTFSTIAEFLAAGGLNRYASESSAELAGRTGIDRDIVTNAWTPLSRVIYDQNLTCNAFAGMAELLSALSASYSILGGNDRLVEALFAAANASISLNTSVVAVERIGQKYALTLQHDGRSLQPDFYDYVAVAAPIEHANLSLVNITFDVSVNRTYHHWYVTHVSAKSLSPAYFAGREEEVPDVVFTLDNSTAPFTVIQIVAQGASGRNIYKIFSNEFLPDSLLVSIFTDFAESFTQFWPYTFPDLSPTADYQPVLLEADGTLLNLNAIESVAVAMGASVPAGRNAALLIGEHIRRSESA